MGKGALAPRLPPIVCDRRQHYGDLKFRAAAKANRQALKELVCL